MKIVIIIIFLITSTLLLAQNERKRELLKELMQTTGALKSTEVYRDAMFEKLEMQYPQISKESWKKIRDKFDIVQLYQEKLIPIYEKYYTEEELDAIIKFYKTPVGQSFIKKQPLILAESIEIGKTWGKEIGESMASIISAEIDHYYESEDETE